MGAIGKAARDWQGDPRLARPPGRVAAFGVFLLAAGALAWMHRDDIFPPEKTAADDPVALCVAGRWAGIDEMVADGTVDTVRAELFNARAEALCQAQLGQGSGPPKLPGQ